MKIPSCKTDRFIFLQEQLCVSLNLSSDGRAVPLTCKINGWKVLLHRISHRKTDVLKSVRIVHVKRKNYAPFVWTPTDLSQVMSGNANNTGTELQCFQISLQSERAVCYFKAISLTSNREISLMGLYTQEDESECSFSNEDYSEGDWGVVTFRDICVHRSVQICLEVAFLDCSIQHALLSLLDKRHQIHRSLRLKRRESSLLGERNREHTDTLLNSSVIERRG